MSDDANEMVGTVQKFYPKEGDNDPFKLIIGGNTYSEFDTALLDDVDTDELEGSEVRFEWEQNGDFRNITSKVEIVDTSPDTEAETYGKTGDDIVTDGDRIRRQSALKSAVTLFQPVMDSGDEMTAERAAEVREMVKETADDFDQFLQDL